MTNSDWFCKDQFGLPPRQVKYSDSYAVGVLINGAKSESFVPKVKEVLFSLYEACTDEWIPMFRSDSRYDRNFGRTKDRYLRLQMFESDLEDSDKIFLFGSQESGLVAYLMMSDQHFILSLYVKPEYRKDRVAMSLLELYLNRFNVSEITASPWALDVNAIGFFKRLGFKEPVVSVNPRTIDLVWRAK